MTWLIRVPDDAGRCGDAGPEERRDEARVAVVRFDLGAASGRLMGEPAACRCLGAPRPKLRKTPPPGRAKEWVRSK